MCGVMAIYAAFVADFTLAFWLIVAAAVFDFFDGFAARMLRAFSPIGADLDSLADVVSFGVAPATIAVSLLSIHPESGAMITPWYGYVGLLLAAFGALRLAKFNIDDRQSEEFIGLPIPGMGLFIASYACTISSLLEPQSVEFIVTTLALVVLFSYLMVSNITMFSFKFKSFGLRTNSTRYFFALFAVIAVIALRYAAPAVIILVYILLSLIRSKSTK